MTTAAADRCYHGPMAGERETAARSTPEGADGGLLGSRYAAVLGRGDAESRLTVLVAFLANLLVAVAKVIAAVITGSASMVAEAAHSAADTGNEVFLFEATRRAARPADAAHPL